MHSPLYDLYLELNPPSENKTITPLYAVTPIVRHKSYFVGKDRESYACLLIKTSELKAERRTPPIRLESLEAQFHLRCHVKKEEKPDKEDTFTVVRCRSLEKETISYFLSVCETIIRVVGDEPSERAVAAAVQRLASILQKIKKPPTRPVSGLFGELYFIWRSGNPVRALKAWRGGETARFDFAEDEIRIDIKTTSSKVRSHIFTYEQCNPPRGTTAIVGSLFAERATGGVSLLTLIQEIESKVSDKPNLVFKLHEVIAITLGANIAESMEMTFDVKLADSSLAFFDLKEIPAIRGPLPGGVSDVHFRSDLSNASSISVESLIDQNPLFWDLLPHLG